MRLLESEDRPTSRAGKPSKKKRGKRIAGVKRSLVKVGHLRSPACRRYEAKLRHCELTEASPEAGGETRWQQKRASHLVARYHFESLAKLWEEDTLFSSSAAQMLRHPAAKRIIAMGPQALPLVLRRLEKGPTRWAWVLAAITGENPASAAEAGNMAALREAWLKLAERKGWLGG